MPAEGQETNGSYWLESFKEYLREWLLLLEIESVSGGKVLDYRQFISVHFSCHGPFGTISRIHLWSALASSDCLWQLADPWIAFRKYQAWIVFVRRESGKVEWLGCFQGQL